MKRIAATAAALAFLVTGQAHAALKVGQKAPEFTTKAALAGKDYNFSLNEALKKGPVVLYFFPAAFTAGCTAEAHEFAEATDTFKSMGATVIGVTAGNIDRIKEFSSLECRDKFAVAGDANGSIIKSYDAVFDKKPEWSNRTSYVITPDHKITLVWSDLKPDEHVSRTLAAVKTWKDSKGKKG